MYGTEQDVRNLNAFPGVAGSQILAYLQMRSGELDVKLAIKGVTVPVTAPPHFLQMLRMAAVYGAAAMVASNPPPGMTRNAEEGAENMYLQEYVRIVDSLDAMETADLVAAGVLSPVAGTLNLGLGIAGAASAVGSAHWSWAYPFQLVKDGGQQ